MKLYSPTGEPYETEDKSEITRLTTVHGYADKKPTPKQVAINTGERAPDPAPKAS